MRQLYRLVLLSLLCGFSLTALSQNKGTIEDALKPLDTLRKVLPIEKLYLHLDKPNYTSGDTIWFKAYLIDAVTLATTDRSGLLYVELDDAAEKSVKRIMVPLASGVSWGNFALDVKTIPAGSYTLRAYTNWMLNFGGDRVFKQQLYVSGINEGFLIAANVKATKQGPKDSIQTALAFSGMDRKPLRLTDMRLTLMDGTKVLNRYKGATDIDGKLNLNFALADKNKKTFIIARRANQKDDDENLIIPISANRPENTDLQFMPEGGNLVNGLPAHVGFKAISEDGHGADVEGKIFDSKQTQVTSFKSMHKGVGVFDFTPQSGETYYAEIQLPGGGKKTYPLPKPIETGTTLKVSPKGKDSLQIQLAISGDLMLKNATGYYLVAQSQGLICFAAQINFKRRIITTSIATSQLPSGITRFTLMDLNRKSVNERIVYINHHNELKITATPNQISYLGRDSVALNIQVADKAGKPVIGTFSVAVTDDSQVKQTETANNILANTLLTSDLKGDVEDPYYYLADDLPETAAALDNLMLTQGWVGYDWKQVYAPLKAPQYIAEKEFGVRGKVTNIFNKPVAKSPLVLFGNKPTTILQALSGYDGRFAFTGMVPVDTPAFVVQARNKRGKDGGVGIEIDDMQPPVFTPSAFITSPWYVNTDTSALRNLHAVQAKQAAIDNALGMGNMLKGVVITAKKIVKESKNLNGSGEADLVFDELDMQKAGNMTLQQLLEQKVKGFKEYGLWDPGIAAKPKPDYYVLNNKRIYFIIDGVNVNFTFNGDNAGPPAGEERGRFLRDYLQYYQASDIKGIEVITSSKYIGAYGSTFLNLAKDDTYGYAFIEITTYGGKGPFMKKSAGVAIYRPLPLSLPKAFYRPRYLVKTPTVISDQRSTIHWEPNLVTDKNGCAAVSFYSADKPGKYTIIIQGTDLNGLIGYQRASITIK